MIPFAWHQSFQTKLFAPEGNSPCPLGHQPCMKMGARCRILDDALTELARGKLREKQPELQRALAGRFRAHQRFLVAQQLAHIDDLEAIIAQLDREIAERLRPFADAIVRLDAIPGIGRRIAEILIAEIGVDMSRFPTAYHLLAHVDSTYQDLGRTYFDRRDSDAIERRLVKRLESLGNRVTVEKVAAPQPASTPNPEAA